MNKQDSTWLSRWHRSSSAMQISDVRCALLASSRMPQRISERRNSKPSLRAYSCRNGTTSSMSRLRSHSVSVNVEESRKETMRFGTLSTWARAAEAASTLPGPPSRPSTRLSTRPSPRRIAASSASLRARSGSGSCASSSRLHSSRTWRGLLWPIRLYRGCLAPGCGDSCARVCAGACDGGVRSRAHGSRDCSSWPTGAGPSWRAGVCDGGVRSCALGSHDGSPWHDGACDGGVRSCAHGSSAALACGAPRLGDGGVPLCVSRCDSGAGTTWFLLMHAPMPPSRAVGVIGGLVAFF